MPSQRSHELKSFIRSHQQESLLRRSCSQAYRAVGTSGDSYPETALNSRLHMKNIEGASLDYLSNKNEDTLKPKDSNAGQAESVRDTAFQDNLKHYLASPEYRAAICDDHTIVRNPRGSFTPYRMRDNYFCILFYNNGHTERFGYVGRLIYWMSVGKVVAVASSASTSTQNIKDSSKIIKTGDSTSSSAPVGSLMLEEGRHHFAIEWSQPEVVLYWDGICLEAREEWNEDWAIVDGPGYADFQEMESGDLAVVESNKLTVRYHTIDNRRLVAMKSQLDPDSSHLHMPRDAVVSWIHQAAEKQSVRKFRCPILPDLRSGGGFTFALWLDATILNASNSASNGVLINGLSKVSAALDEPQKITKTEDSHSVSTNMQVPDGYTLKGYTISHRENKLVLEITDGFNLRFSYDVDLPSIWKTKANIEYYGFNSNEGSGAASSPKPSPHLFCFTLDGGPKIASCVINERLYNAAPCGWKFIPRDMGEIGGANAEILSSKIQRFEIYDRPLSVTESVALSRHALIHHSRL